MNDPLVLADVGQTFRDTVISGPVVLALGVCVLAGLVSFASPCVIPLVPGYLSYLAGLVGAEAPAVTPDEPPKNGRWRVVGAAAMFVLGFTVVYVMAAAAVFGLQGFLLDQQRLELMQRIGGVLIVVMGLVFLGAVPLMQRSRGITPWKVSNWVGAPLLGAVFAFGWIPCSSATLGAVLLVAMSTEGTDAARGVAFVVAYCIGLGIPFILLALSSAWAVRSLAFLRRNARTIQLIGGITMIIIGFLLAFGVWADFTDWARRSFITDTELPI